MSSGYRKSTNENIQNWPLWKLMIVVVPTFGLFALMIGFYPDYSPVALAFGIALALVIVMVTAVGSHRESWYFQMAYATIWSGLFIIMGVRAWIELLPTVWLWLTLHTFLYVGVWSLPIIFPEFSGYLVREQTNPETQVGKKILRLSVVLLPVAGGLGASIGLYGPRYVTSNWILLIVGALGSAVGLGFGQYFSSKLWPTRPWAPAASEGGESNDHE